MLQGMLDLQLEFCRLLKWGSPEWGASFPMMVSFLQQRPLLIKPLLTCCMAYPFFAIVERDNPHSQVALFFGLWMFLRDASRVDHIRIFPPLSRQ